MKQLHLANIANVAYGYARILRAADVDADVLCYDLGHILSLPEWVEGDFDIAIGDEWHPDLGRPEIAATEIPPWYRRIRSQDLFRSADLGTAVTWTREWVDAVVRATARFGPRWAVRREDVVAYQPLCELLEARFLPGYDLVFGYAYGAVPPLLVSSVPYVPVEIGTLRDTVNINSPLGRLLALAYRTAPHTIITNADCRSAAQALELQNYSYVPHPVDEDVFRPLPPEERAAVRRSLCRSRHLLIAPARQAWDVKANDRYLRAFAELAREGADVTLLIAEWGPDVGRARALIDDLRIGGFVRWFSPAPERRLAKMLAAADLVLDQFGTFGTFGLIAPKAMACATPCLLSFDPGVHTWCFDDIPPLIAASDEPEILNGMRHFLGDSAARDLRGAQSREWIVEHHSKAVVATKMARIAKAVTSRSRARTGFDDLRAQRMVSIVAPPSPLMRRSRVWLGGVRRTVTRLRRLGPVLKETAVGLRQLRFDRERLGRLEQALHAEGERLGRAEQALHAEGERLGRVEQALHLEGERVGLVEQALQVHRERLDQHQQTPTADHERIEDQALQWQQGLAGAFDLMGQNRLEDRKVLTAVRSELLECLVRSRLAAPLRDDRPLAGSPRLRESLALPQARSRLQAAAPLNWPTYLECLERGTASYECFPSGSCSTVAHPQADLFRAFVRPYLRGQVLDVGCGPQFVPWYLHDYPLSCISGIDPISAPADHPFHFVPGFGELLPWDDAQFDVVVSGTSLDHYYLLDIGMREAFRVLRPGGHFLAWITEFAGAPPYDPYSARLERPYDPEHLFHIDRSWFLPLMARSGFVESEILHFELPFNYLFMSFEKPVVQRAMVPAT